MNKTPFNWDKETEQPFHMDYEDWVQLPMSYKIPFNTVLKLILHGDGRDFGHVGFQVLSHKHGLDIPNRKQRQCSVKAWFIKNIKHLTQDDRSAIEIMQSSMQETINHSIINLRQLEGRE